MNSSRAEHLRWCKDRAIEYVDRGDLKTAWISMLCDLGKHDETQNHPAIGLGTQMFIGGLLSTQDSMRAFIEGFN